LRNLGHPVEGVLGGGPACAEFQRARVDDLTSSPTDEGRAAGQAGVLGGEHPTTRGLQAPMGESRAGALSLVLQSGDAASRRTLPLIARGPVRAAAARPGGASRRLRRWGEGGERRRGAGFLLRSSANLARGRPSGDPAAGCLRRTDPELRGERLGKRRGSLSAHVFSALPLPGAISSAIRLCSNGDHPRGQGSGERIECHRA